MLLALFCAANTKHRVSKKVHLVDHATRVSYAISTKRGWMDGSNSILETTSGGCKQNFGIHIPVFVFLFFLSIIVTEGPFFFFIYKGVSSLPFPLFGPLERSGKKRETKQTPFFKRENESRNLIWAPPGQHFGWLRRIDPLVT